MKLFAFVKNRGIILLIITMLFYVVFTIFSDVNELTSHFKNVDYFLIIPILLVTTIGLFVKSIRQYLFLETVGIKISFKQNFVLYFAGLAMLGVPFGAGGLIKSHFLLKHFDQPASKTVPIILVERFHDAVAMFSIILIFALITNFGILNIPIIIIGMFLLFCILVLKNKNLAHRVVTKLTKIKFLKITEENVEQFSNVLVSFSSNKKMVTAWLIGLAGWFFDALAIFLSFLAFGLNFDFLLTTIIGFASVLFGSLSFLPGGIGVTELSFVQLLLTYKIELSLATALVIFIRLTGLWFATCLGFFAIKFVSNKN